MKRQVGMNLEAKFVHIPREENIDANRLAIAASSGSMTLIRQVLSFIQYSPATNEVEAYDPNRNQLDGKLQDHNAIEGPSITLLANKRCFIQRGLLPSISKVFVGI